jgi:hypothetical protein
MEVEDKGTLTRYEPVPLRKMYIAVCNQTMSYGNYHFCASSTDKAELIKNLQNIERLKSVKIYIVDLED